MPSKNSDFFKIVIFLHLVIFCNKSLKNYDNSWVMKKYEYDQLLTDFNSIQNYLLQH